NKHTISKMSDSEFVFIDFKECNTFKKNSKDFLIVDENAFASALKN
ncbi:17258_t:CDS:1, partial [Dentiscutata heterogama]